VTALSAVFLKEHLTTPKVVALFLALSGTALTIQISSGGSIIGILLGIAAAVDYAIYILLGSRIVRRSGSISSTAIIIASTAGVYAIIAPIQGITFPLYHSSRVLCSPTPAMHRSSAPSGASSAAGLARVGVLSHRLQRCCVPHFEGCACLRSRLRQRDDSRRNAVRFLEAHQL
jgi:drug/metabolite transporter (DMT)-like permease